MKILLSDDVVLRPFDRWRHRVPVIRGISSGVYVIRFIRVSAGKNRKKNDKKII